MNDQVASAVRSLLKVFGGILIAKGVTDSSTVEVVISSLMVIGGFVWSYYNHSTPPADNPPTKTP